MTNINRMSYTINTNRISVNVHPNLHYAEFGKAWSFLLRKQLSKILFPVKDRQQSHFLYSLNRHYIVK